jgi:hypothetical protein
MNRDGLQRIKSNDYLETKAGKRHVKVETRLTRVADAKEERRRERRGRGEKEEGKELPRRPAECKRRGKARPVPHYARREILRHAFICSVWS